MKGKLVTTLLLLAPFLGVTPISVASTTWYVNGVSGSNLNTCTAPTNACRTIGHAISLASSGDTIMVAPAIYKEHLNIQLNLGIVGSGASTTIIDGTGTGTVVTVGSPAHVTVSKVTVRNGVAKGGGGILNFGTLTISKSTVSGNAAYRGFFTVGSAGGGVFSAHCTFSGYSTIINSTLSGNSASSGGGIFARGAAINNSTLSGNSAGRGGGGGISGVATIQNSIVANNSGGNCAGTMTSNGYNLSSDGSCNFNGPGDLNNTNPMLGPLQNNGGPTQTMAVPSGSPAVDAGNPSGCTDGSGHLLKTDQRGQPRPDAEDTGGCDMGAYESQSD